MEGGWCFGGGWVGWREEERRRRREEEEEQEEEEEEEEQMKEEEQEKEDEKEGIVNECGSREGKSEGGCSEQPVKASHLGVERQGTTSSELPVHYRRWPHRAGPLPCLSRTHTAN